MKVLVVNAGSSSLKYQLMNTETKEVLGKGICERIGMEGSLIDHKLGDGSKKIKKEIPMPNHSVATEIVVNMLTDAEYGCISSMDEIDAIVEDTYAEIDAAVLSDVISDKMDEFDDFVDSLGYDYSADEDFINLVDEYKLSFTAATSVAELNEIYSEAVSALEDYISNLDAENDPENDPVTE